MPVKRTQYTTASNEPRRPMPVLFVMENLKLNLSDGEILLDHLLGQGVDIAHDCGGVLACTSCRVVIREGLEHLQAPSNDELDLLDRADSMAANERLACQVRGTGELVIELPRDEAPVHKIERPVFVSARAAKHLAAQLAKHPGAVAVRLSALPSGCSGFRYRVDPTNAVHDGDRVFDTGGVRVAIDATSLPYVQGTTLDVVDEGLSRRLRFDNPNAKQTCGCGESFGV
jgi:iron-sulfur cluster assembly protein